MNQRMKWDAEAAFERMNRADKLSIREPHERGHAYAPPSNIGPERLAQLRKYEHPAKPKGRDYDAILRAAKKAPVGYYEDAPHGIKFGGQPLPSASAKPHGKDVDTPWPKCLFGMKDGKIRTCIVYTSNETGVFWWNREEFTHPESAAYTYDFNSRRADMTTAADETAASWLEQNGHKDVAAQLRGAPRADVATGGGRVYLEKTMWYRVRIGERVFFRAHPSIKNEQFGTAWHEQPYGGFMEPRNADECIRTRGGTELFGPERDAILSECREAMQCPQKPAP